MQEAEDNTPKPETDASREAKQAEQKIVTIGKNQEPEMTLLLAPEAQSNPAVQEVLKNVTLKLRTWRGTEIEVPLSEINIGGGVHSATATRGYTSCGNCGERIPYSSDAQENHHNAMRHKFACPKRHQAATEHAELVNAFEAQPNVRAMRDAYAAQQRHGIEGFLRVENLPESGTPLRLPTAPAALARTTATPAPARRWWQFWRRK